MKQLFVEYKRIYSDTIVASGPHGTFTCVSSTSSISASSVSTSKINLDKRVSTKNRLTDGFKKKKSSNGEHVKSELDRYLGEAVEDDDEKDEKRFDILQW